MTGRARELEQAAAHALAVDGGVGQDTPETVSQCKANGSETPQEVRHLQARLCGSSLPPSCHCEAPEFCSRSWKWQGRSILRQACSNQFTANIFQICWSRDPMGCSPLTLFSAGMFKFAGLGILNQILVFGAVWRGKWRQAFSHTL